MVILNTLLFWSAVVLSITTIHKMYLSKGIEAIHPRKLSLSANAYALIFALAAFVAVFVRIYQFGQVPGGFNQDGAMAAVDAKALAEYGTDRFGMRLPVHLTAWGYGQMSSLLSYLMGPFIRLFGLSPIVARLPQLLISLSGLFILYLFVRDAFDKNAALIVFLFAAINPWHILQSRWTLDCNLYPHFFLMGIFFLNLSLKKKKRQVTFLCISMSLFGLCMYCYGISIYTMPVFLLSACLYLLTTKKLPFRRAVLAFFVYMAVAWPFIAVMAINFFKWDTAQVFLFTLPYFPGSVRSNDILFFSNHIWTQLSENLQALLRITLYQMKDLPWNDVEGFGTMYLFSIPFAFAGLSELLLEFRKKAGAIFVLLFLSTGIWCGLVTNNVNINRLNLIYYPLLILTGLGIYETMRWLFFSRAKYGIAAAYTAAFVLFVHTYFTNYADTISYYFFKDFGEAVSSLKESDAQKFYITADSQYAGATAVSEILTLFWHETDAAYFQGKSTPSDILPYADRYTFARICDLAIDPSEDAAYVVTAADLAYFDSSLYDFQQFGNYYTVTPK